MASARELWQFVTRNGLGLLLVLVLLLGSCAYSKISNHLDDLQTQINQLRREVKKLSAKQSGQVLGASQSTEQTTTASDNVGISSNSSSSKTTLYSQRSTQSSTATSPSSTQSSSVAATPAPSHNPSPSPSPPPPSNNPPPEPPPPPARCFGLPGIFCLPL